MKQDPYQTLQPGQYYHLYNRGNNKEIIFKEPQNYDYFLFLWRKHIDPVARTYCYALLPNHFHFLIRMEEKDGEVQTSNNSQAFSNFFNAYAKAINKKYNRTGSLFQERFRRKQIVGDEYFTTIVGYILTNPIKHGYCKNAAVYAYSAYNSLLSGNPTTLARDELIQWFHNKEKLITYVESYMDYLQDLESPDLTGLKTC